MSSFHWQYAQTTIGWKGTPSGQNMGPTHPGNPAESGLLLTSGKYWISIMIFMLYLSQLTTNLKNPLLLNQNLLKFSGTGT